jgi:hypothetical protein
VFSLFVVHITCNLSIDDLESLCIEIVCTGVADFDRFHLAVIPMIL